MVALNRLLGIAVVTFFFIVGLAVLATAVADLDSASAAKCMTSDASDCSIAVRIETAEDDVKVHQRVEVNVSVGTEVLILNDRGSNQTSGTGKDVQIEQSVSTNHSIVLEPGDEEASTAINVSKTDTSRDERYYVVANITSDTDWKLRQDPAVKEINLLEIAGGKEVVFNLTKRDSGGTSEAEIDEPNPGLFPFDLVLNLVQQNRTALGILLFLAMGAGLVGVFTLSYRDRGDGGSATDRSPSDKPGSREIGRIAGEAADRIDDAASHENAVYRAWYEMIRELDIDDPETVTPGEFADRAVKAGIDKADVDELTDLFEKVRYGDRDPTDYEDQALATLRRIEATYADDTEGES